MFISEHLPLSVSTDHGVRVLSGSLYAGGSIVYLGSHGKVELGGHCLARLAKWSKRYVGSGTQVDAFCKLGCIEDLV